MFYNTILQYNFNYDLIIKYLKKVFKLDYLGWFLNSVQTWYYILIINVLVLNKIDVPVCHKHWLR